MVMINFIKNLPFITLRPLKPADRQTDRQTDPSHITSFIGEGNP